MLWQLILDKKLVAVPELRIWHTLCKEMNFELIEAKD